MVVQFHTPEAGVAVNIQQAVPYRIRQVLRIPPAAAEVRTQVPDRGPRAAERLMSHSRRRTRHPASHNRRPTSHNRRPAPHSRRRRPLIQRLTWRNLLPMSRRQRRMQAAGPPQEPAASRSSIARLPSARRTWDRAVQGPPPA